MLILTALLSLSPLVDSFTAGITVQYVDVLLRVGFAGFLLGNVAALDPSSEAHGDIGAEEPPTHGVAGGAVGTADAD